MFANDHITSGRGHSDDAYLVLNLRIGGFRGTEEVVEGKPRPVGKLSFTFETDCQEDCSLTLMQVTYV